VEGASVTDLEGKLERFETLAAECELIAKLSTDKAKRELYSRAGRLMSMPKDGRATRKLNSTVKAKEAGGMRTKSVILWLADLRPSCPEGAENGDWHRAFRAPSGVVPGR
jgi:hypothetical protein